MKHITTIHDYCAEINIPAPRYPFFDIRRFEDNMKTVNAVQPPFRHEFYAIALRLEGSNREVNGQQINSSIFFNSPYQVITWDIKPDWEGYYIILDRQFISMNPAWRNFVADYPFLRLDQHIAFDLPEAARQEALGYFERIFEEYHSHATDKFQFITGYTQLLLSITRRQFEMLGTETGQSESNRTADVLLVSRFQTLVETMLTQEGFDPARRQTSFYAEELGVHPNHLNAVVKRITDHTCTSIIRNYIMSIARSLLSQTVLSAKEIAYRLHFTEPTHFNAFFKKNEQMTPQQYRDKAHL